MISPCKGCEKRHPGCHGECDAYKTWSEANYKRLHPDKGLDRGVRANRHSMNLERFRNR